MRLLIYLSIFFIPFSICGQPCSTFNATNCLCPDGSDTCFLLPDIRISDWALQNEWNGPSEYGSVGYGPNSGKIRITGSTPNIGYGPLHIKAAQLWVCGTDTFNYYPLICAGGGLPRQLIKQIVYKKEGSNFKTIERYAGSMTYHPSHFHVHVDDWTVFTLRVKNPLEPDTLKWPIVGDGSKISYCLMDYGRCSEYPGHCKNSAGNTLLDQDIKNFGLGGGNFNCSPTEQGISVGYTDIYEEFLDGMWINLPAGLCNGIYWLIAEVDPLNQIEEMDESNNHIIIPIKLTEQIAVTEALKISSNRPVFNSIVEITDNDTVAFSSIATGLEYLWSTGDTSFSIQVTKAGKYAYRLKTLCGYLFSDTIEVKKIIIDAPVVSADTVCINNTAVLTVNTSADEQVVWFNASGAVLDTGNSYVTEPLSVNTTYYVEKQKINPVLFVGPKDASIGNAGHESDRLEGLYFDVHFPVKIKSVSVTANYTGYRSIVIKDHTNIIIFFKTYGVPTGTSRIPLNVSLPPGKNYHINQTDTRFLRNSTGADFPYSIHGLIDITATAYAQGYYHFFYDWEVEPLLNEKYKSAKTRIEVVVEQCLGIDPVSKIYNLNIFPVPANDHLIIQFNTTPGTTGTIELYTLDGKQIYEEEFKDVVERSLNISHLQQGLYLLKISSDGESIRKKVIIQ